MLQLIQTQLLCNISAAISGGVAPADVLTCGAGAPTSTPSTNCALYVDTAAEAIYYWDGAWHLKV